MTSGKSSGATSEQIASVALRLLEREGPEAVTMRQVAKAVGITPMAIYYHFANREALLKTVTDAEFDKLRSRIEEIRLRRGGNPLTRLNEMLATYIDYALLQPRLFDYVFSKPRPDARRFPEDFRARRSPTLTPIADTVAAAMQAGDLKRDDVWEVTLALWAHLHGYLVLYLGGRFQLADDEFRQLCRRSVRRFMDGIKVKKTRKAKA
jgi:AcrR family transcriptional regulator